MKKDFAMKLTSFKKITHFAFVLCLCFPLLSLQAFQGHGRLGIIGGVDAKVGDNPQIVSITKTGQVGPFCAGTLINKDWVVTAAHCLVNSRVNPYEIIKTSVFLVAISDWDTNIDPDDIDPNNLNKESRHVKKIVIYPYYRPIGNQSDIALLQLKVPVTKTTPQAIGRVDTVNLTQDATIWGWGNTESDPDVSPAYPFILQTAKVNVFPNSQCSDWLKTVFNGQIMLCAGLRDGGIDTCQGDSGGPITLDGKLIGITSFGFGCAQPQSPGVYTRISNYQDWINSIISGETIETDPEFGSALGFAVLWLLPLVFIRRIYRLKN